MKRTDQDEVGNGGETHQTATGDAERLTTNQGVVLSDNQSSLTAGPRGPTLLEDFILREKITHFDHERIPERIVHARGSAAHGYFEPYPAAAKLSKAAFLQDPGVRTPVFVRFSTVAGSKGSFDLARDVRGFATEKFYTSEGNFDLVGNNMPVFFIQDAMKFPDLIHSVKPEQDCGFPQAASAHDTFWDFVSLMPESTHMLLWAMSDRGIPRSYRTMEGFGVNTFRFVDAANKAVFVKFHWRPLLGSFSVIWDEAVKVNGADPDFHRRDLWETIEGGDVVEYELSVQVVDDATADALDFDILDASKIVPEEIVPLTPIGKMVLDRNPEEFFAETEQVAFCPSHVVPGIDFSEDPLLQGRLFSYLDTQLSRLGSPNFHQLEINKPKCPFQNFQRGGHMRQGIAQNARISYEPNSLGPQAPREDPKRGFASAAVPVAGEKRRIRPESFADHYSQARLFWISQTDTERAHIAGAFAFELGKVETVAIRERMLANLVNVTPELAQRVAGALGMPAPAQAAATTVPAKDLPASPALSLLGKAPKSIKGKKIAVLVTDDVDDVVLDALAAAALKEGAKVQIVAPKAGGVKSKGGKQVPADHALPGAPSVLFDAVVLAVSDAGVKKLVLEAAAVDWVRDAFGHLKVIGHVGAAQPLLDKAGIVPDAGVVNVDGGKVTGFVAAAKEHRIWDREPGVRALA